MHEEARELHQLRAVWCTAIRLENQNRKSHRPPPHPAETASGDMDRANPGQNHYHLPEIKITLDKFAACGKDAQRHVRSLYRDGAAPSGDWRKTFRSC